MNQANDTEKALTGFCKYILNVPRNADHLAIYGELGVYPLYIDAIKSMLSYWNFIEYKSNNILLKDAYQYNKETITSNQSNWLEFAYKIVN